LETDLDRYHEDCARLATMAKVTFLRLPEAGTGEDASKHA